MQQHTTLRKGCLLLFLTILGTVAAWAQVKAPVANVGGGRYSDSVTVELSSATSEAIIRYSLDGSVPDSLTAPQYTGPLTFNKTTTLRARAFVLGQSASTTTTHTYFINVKHTFPIIAISFNNGDFFNDSTGIYTNFTNNLEVPINIELIEKDSTKAAFTQQVGAEIQGSASAQLPQKSLDIKPKRVYGADNIAYRLFPDLPYNSYRRFILRNSGQDWGITMFRDDAVSSLATKIDDLGGIIQKPEIYASAFRPAMVYYNGQFWGIYSIKERMKTTYVEQRFGLRGSEYDMLENEIEKLNGDSITWMNFFIQLNSADNYADDAVFKKITDSIDVQNFLDYNVFNVYIDNQDWPGNNVRRYKPRKEGGKWRWISYDFDFSFGLFQAGQGFNTGDPTPNSLIRQLDLTKEYFNNPYWATLLFRRCMENATFRRNFINRTADMMNTVFNPKRVNRRFDEFQSQYAPEMPFQTARWGAPQPSLWLDNINKMRFFADNRAQNLVKHFDAQFAEVTGTAQVTIDVQPSGAGMVRYSTLSLDSAFLPWTGLYFTGVDIPVKAVAKEGYRFVRWEGKALPARDSAALNLSENTNLTAIFERIPVLVDTCANDTTKPVWANCPINQQLTTTGTCAVATWIVPTATDDCGTPSVSSNFNAGFCFPIGITQVVYTATDAKGNTSTCAFSVQVAQAPPPVPDTCKQFRAVNTNNVCGCPQGLWKPYGLVFQNNANCAADTLMQTESLVFEQNSNGTASLKGTLRNSNNFALIAVDIQLTGGTRTPPNGAPIRLFCAKNQNVSAANWVYYTGLTGTYREGNAAPVAVTLDSAAFQVGVGAGMQRTNVLGASARIRLGNNRVGWFNLQLANEQIITCPQTVSVCANDTVKPTLANCPANVSVKTTADCAVVNWTAPTATDNCGTPSVSSNFNAGFCFPIGTTSVTYTATDARNNRATCAFNVTVERDAVAPPAGTFSLRIASDVGAYRQYESIRLTLSAVNKSPNAMSNLKLTFPYPSGTVFGGAETATAGQWSSYCAGGVMCYEWTIPRLAAGDSASLSLRLFTLVRNTPLVSTARLLSSVPIVTNADGLQAALSIPFQGASAPATNLNRPRPTQLVPLVVQSLAPNPTDSELSVEVESIVEKTVQFNIVNALGQVVKSEPRMVTKGTNQFTFDVTDLQGGVYFIFPETNIARNVPTKFVKM